MLKDFRIPQPLKGEMTVTVNLPPEALQLMTDLHADREGIAVGSIVLIACVVALTLRRFFSKV